MKTRNRIRPRVEELESRLAPATLANSTNWSGYAVSTGAGAVTQVAGSWVVPAVATTVSGYSSAWVGIDGWSSSSVEQIGTDSDYVNGRAQYYAWYEMYPAGSVNLSLPIHAGDTISASVTNTALGQFALSITDVTTGGTFSTTQNSSQAQRSSAEWIQEAPSSFSGVLPLANFGKINFSGANATVNGTPGPADNSWSGTTLYQVNMVTNTGALKAQTSALSDSGVPLTSNFSVTWVSSGSGGKGHGHKSANVPPPELSPTTALLSAAVAPVTASPLGTPASAAAQSPTVTLALAAVGARPATPAWSAVPLTFAPPGLDAADQAETPELPLRDGSAVPVDPAASSPTDGLPTPRADQTPANGPEMARAAEAIFADGSWLPVAALEGARGPLDGGHEGRGSALAGLVLTLAIAPTWANVRRGGTGERDGVEEQPGRNRERRRVRPWC